MSLILPFNQWPSVDRLMWQALCHRAGPLDDPGALSHLRATSLATLQTRYSRWLKWVETADAAALKLRPEMRASCERLQRWLVDLDHTKPMSRLMFVDGVLRILRAAAPKADWTSQLRLRKALKRVAGRGDTARKSGRILSSDVLLTAGMELFVVNATPSLATVRQMLCQRDGLMIALLAVLPMRRRAFCSLALGESVHVSDDAILITLSEAMTKSGVAWEAAVPDQLAEPLQYYVRQTRPVLLGRGDHAHSRLWVGKKGEIMGEDYIGQRIGQVTRALTGQRVPPHFFRDAAATTLARRSPQSARLIRPLLAHRDFGTAERHYIHAQTIDAGRDYASLVKRLKGDTP